MRMLCMEQCCQNSSTVHFVSSARLRLEQRVLQHLLECNRLFRQRARICINHFTVSSKELLDVLLQSIAVAAAMIDYVARSGIVEQCQQQMFQRYVLMFPRG